MPENKELEKLLRIAKNGAIEVHDEVVELEEVVEKNHTELKEDIKEVKEMTKDFGGVERLKGDVGGQGEQGDKGEQGESIKGDKGDTGTDSTVKGDTGEQGEQGDKGEQGIGKAGKDGADGKDGKDGSDVDKSVVEELKDTIKKLEDRVKKIPSRVMTPRYVHVPMVDVFTGDASTKEFTLSKAPKSLDTMKGWGSDFPFILVNGSDGGFTVVGKTLTLNDGVDAPSLDARLIIEYYV